jgi:hypothetical protein
LAGAGRREENEAGRAQPETDIGCLKGTHRLRPKGFKLFELPHAATKILVRVEAGVQIRPQNLLGQLDANDPGAQAEQVNVVVLHALMSAEGVVTQIIPAAASTPPRQKDRRFIVRSFQGR